MSLSQAFKDRLIPWYFVAFFVFLAIINGAMIYIAVHTQTGVVTDHPYEKGLAYNKVVEAEEAQEKLGWKGQIEYNQESKEISFILHDKEGKTIYITSARAEITRPIFNASAPQGMDFSVELKKLDDGKFGAKIDFPKMGLWEVRIFAISGDNKYQQSKRIVVE